MSSVYENLSVEELIEKALERNEGEIASNGALLVKTGKRTGRSPLDRFIVKDELTVNSVACEMLINHFRVMLLMNFGQG
jgi:phosphoenolpyruvate carboxykinase (ATP)